MQQAPPTRKDRVPIDVEALEDLGDGSWRLRFITIADDGNPTIFDEEVTPEGDVEEWVRAFLSQHQTTRARLNREAIAKRGEEEAPRRTGAPDRDVAQRLDGLFPTQR